MASKPGTKAPTITDVARVAGVAASTVSRALSNPDRVNAATRERILEAAGSLHYIPSSQARALRSGQKLAIAVLVPDISNPYYFGIIRGTQLGLKAAGYTQLLVDTEESAESEIASLRKLRSSVDGFVLTASRLTQDQIDAVAAQSELVVINRQIPGVHTVSADTSMGMRQAMEHLSSLGHRRVAYLSGPASSWSNAQRWNAVRTSAKALGMQAFKTMELAPNVESGAAAVDSVLNLSTTALLAYNDLLAVGAQLRLQERGLRVPEDFSVVGCDDIQLSKFCSPALTTISAPIEQVGRTAVGLLLRQLQGEGNAEGGKRHFVLPTHLTIRASSGSAPSARKGKP